MDFFDRPLPIQLPVRTRRYATQSSLHLTVNDPIRETASCNSQSIVVRTYTAICHTQNCIRPTAIKGTTSGDPWGTHCILVHTKTGRLQLKYDGTR